MIGCVVTVTLTLLVNTHGKPTAIKAHPAKHGCADDVHVVLQGGPRVKRTIDICPLRRA